jgi:pimeloyl-ACP methyl ester carboxylesterase
MTGSRTTSSGLAIVEDPGVDPAVPWTGALFASLEEQDARTGRLATLETPVSLIFGARDPYLSPGVADHLASLFPNAATHLLDSASHWPRWDDPARIATLIADSL